MRTLPTGWDLQPLGELCSRPQYGLTETASSERVGPRFIRITDIQNGEVNWPTVPYCKCSREDLERHRVQPGDLLVARIGGTTGKTFFVRDCPEDAVFASYLIRLRANSVDERYLYYFCQSPSYWDHINASKDERLKGGVNTRLLTQLEVPVPPPETQRQIAGFLEAIEFAAKCQLKISERLADLKTAAMAKIFREGICGEPIKQVDFGECPESWQIVSLDTVAEVQTGVAKGRRFNDSDLVEVPYLRVANVQDGHLDLAEMKTIEIRRSELQRYLLKDGDVVLTEGGDFDKLGRGFIWRSELPECIHQNHVFAVRADRGLLSPEFLAYLAQSPYGKTYFLHVAHKTTNLACINSSKLKGFPVLLPSLEEQAAITGLLDLLDRKLQASERRCRALNALFATTLSALMSGTLRVTIADSMETEHA